MKRPPILLLLVCAAALPAAALAQVEAEASGNSVEMLTTKWSLGQARNKPVRAKQALLNEKSAKWRKRPPIKAFETTRFAGAKMPAAQHIKLPRQKKKRKSPQRLPNNRTNAAKMITKVIRE